MAMVDYAYSNTRIRVMKSLFLKNRDLEALSRAKNFEDYLTSLKQTQYSGIFSGMEKATIHEIERVLSIDLKETIDKVMGISPQSCVPFLDAVSKKYQLEYIKLILNSKVGNLSEEEIMSKFFIPEKSTEEFLSRLINLPIEPIDDIIALLCSRYKGLDEFIPESPQLLDILIALDKYYFSELQRSVKYLKRGDKKIASRLISMEIDISNIMIILRSITRGYEIERFIIPNRSSYLTALDEYTPDNVIEFIENLSKTIYGSVLEDVVPIYKRTDSLLCFELALKRFLIGECKKIMKEHQFQLGFILGFLKLKEMEIGNLKAICVGIGESLPSEEIRDLLVF